MPPAQQEEVRLALCAVLQFSVLFLDVARVVLLTVANRTGNDWLRSQALDFWRVFCRLSFFESLEKKERDFSQVPRHRAHVHHAAVDHAADEPEPADGRLRLLLSGALQGDVRDVSHVKIVCCLTTC